MVLAKLNHELNSGFFGDTADLKKHVFINLRKQNRQKREGFCAGQF